MLKSWALIAAVFFLLPAHAAVPKHKIDHVVVIYLENHSFYNIFAEFPGADNQLPAGYKGQVDKDGHLYKDLPAVCNHHGLLDKRFPAVLPNRTFLIDKYAGEDQKTPDPNHEFFSNIVEIDGGKMDKYAAYSRVGALVMGYYDMKKSNLWKYAREYTLADHFFQSAIGGSFINHQYLIAARTPRNLHAPQNLKCQLLPNGALKKYGLYTPDGYAVNTIEALTFPHDPKVKDPARRLPPVKYKNIGDLMTKADVSWAWYAGGWNDVLRGHPNPEFQYHHLPFLYFAKYGPHTKGRKEHIKDETDLFNAIRQHHLPQVAFFKPIGDENEHPGYSDVSSGDQKLKAVVEAIKSSSYWPNTLIVVTFDESGGFWDPVAPPRVDRFGLGARIPAVFISPQVKKGFIDHTQYETVSIISYIEKRFRLPHLTKRDAKANPLKNIFL